MHLVHSIPFTLRFLIGHIILAPNYTAFELHISQSSEEKNTCTLSQPQTFVRPSTPQPWWCRELEIRDVAFIDRAIIARGAVSKETDGAVADDGAKSNAQHETRNQHHSGGLLRGRNCIFHRPFRATCDASSKMRSLSKCFLKHSSFVILTHFISLSGRCARS